MNTENLLKACASATSLADELCQAHKDACDTPKNCAHLLLLDLIGDAVRIRNQIKQIKDSL